MNTTNRRNFLKGLVALAVAPKVAPKLIEVVDPLMLAPGLGAMPEKIEGAAVHYMTSRSRFAEVAYPGIHKWFLHYLEEREKDGTGHNFNP